MQPNRPPLVGSLVPPQNTLPSMSMQYRPVVPPQQPQPYISMPPQQFQPIGHANIGMPMPPPPPPPPPPPQIQFPQQMTQLPARPGAVGDVMPQSQAIPVQDFQPSRPVTPVPAQPSQNLQISNNYMPGFSGPRIPLSSSYNLSLSSAGQQQTNTNSAAQYQSISQTTVPNFPVDGQPWLSTGTQSMKPVTPAQRTAEQSVPAVNLDKIAKPGIGEKVPSVWIEHTARNGKKYYYNRMTRLSSWEKPLELMTPIERVDASTDWREYTCPDGRKYYYNKVTKQSKWRIPDELKLAREGLKLDSLNGIQAANAVDSHAPASVPLSGVNTSSSNVDMCSFSTQTAISSPIPVAPVVPEQPMNSVSSVSPKEVSPVAMDAVETVETATPVVLEKDANSVTSANTFTTQNNSDTLLAQDTVTSVVGVSPGNTEEAKIGVQDYGKSEEKKNERGPIIYESKLEAKNAFKALLETANVGSDWTWDQAMRAIINDRRYGALKTLGERKQAFNEFVGQKKKQEAEDRRARLRKAREDFKKMLEESKELTSSSRWSKTISIFEDEERFKAVERPKDREDLFEDYIKELERKERARALEEHKRNKVEYLEFLKSCDFIKASSQWRKVQDRVEADERCSRLEKIDRLEIFQEYIRDLEKEEEEQRRLRMEEQRKAERKNRDEFRKLMEEHVAAGILTAKSHWRDYCMKVKDSPAYLAVSSNTSGSTAKDLFEDVAEELEKQFLEDKAQIKDVIKIGEITLTSTWTVEDFKTAILKNTSTPPVSDVNLKLVFDELLERVREKEEKEAKRRKRLGDDLYEFLLTSKEITLSSKWEDCRRLVEDRFVGEESFFQEIFDKFILEQKERAKEREHKRREDKTRKDKERKNKEKKKDRQRREKEKGDESRKRKDRPKSDESDTDGSESHGFEDDKRSGRDKDKRNRNRYSSPLDDMSLDDIEKDRSRDSRRHTDDRKRLKRVEQQLRTSEVASESQNKRHRRDHRDGDYDENRDVETGEDVEIY